MAKTKVLAVSLVSFFVVLGVLLAPGLTKNVVANLDNDLVIDGTTITLSGIQNYDNVYIKNGGKLRVDPVQDWLELNVKGEVLVDSSSAIVLNAMASGPGDGLVYGYNYDGSKWGHDWIAGGGGAGYGGSGGQGDGWYGAGAFGGLSYGDPNNGGAYTGSRGSDGKYAWWRGPGIGGGAGGLGGGRIKINASTINIKGSIQANGGNGSTYASGGGGGSGGGITLEASNVIISGFINANGGRGADGAYAGGGGAGGRITIIYGTKTISGSLTANGGDGGKSWGGWPDRGYGVAGQDGTITYILSIIPATVDCNPDTLNLNSKGDWVTCYIELPSGYDVKNIDAATILLNGVVSPELDPKYGFVKSEQSYIMDHDGDGILERMVKFDRSAVQALFSGPVDSATLTLTGKVFYNAGLADFEGSDTIRVIDKGNGDNGNGNPEGKGKGKK